MLMLCLAAIDSEKDRKSFEEIYHDHKNILYAHAFSILKDVPSAEDAVQDCFVALARNFSKTYAMDCNQIRSYLIIITRNAAYKIYNKRKREISTEDIYMDREDTSDMTLDTENRELRKKLYDMIGQLDSKYGDVIMLKYYCGMRDKDIAQTLDLSVENVKIRLYRARAMLKNKLREGGYCD
ncbi:MAG: RNA polymerase sigma factor [Clostridia bacterium]|nr:RNA polymerase sigma factor [Clostridia bacterium]